MLTEIELQKKRERKADKRRNIGYRGAGAYTGKRDTVGTCTITYPPPGALPYTPVQHTKKPSVFGRVAQFFRRVTGKGA